MERPPMFMHQQNKYCENGYAAQRDLQIQCSSSKSQSHSSQKYEKKSQNLYGISKDPE
jgi:hypothetical protein